VTDRHAGKWFGHVLAVRLAGGAEASRWIESFLLHYELAHGVAGGEAAAAGGGEGVTPPTDPAALHQLHARRHAQLHQLHSRRYTIARYVAASGRRRIGESFAGKSAIARRASSLGPTTAGFADCAPLHLATTTSLGELNRRLAAKGAAVGAVDLSRFRPNIVVAGAAAPHSEDTWQTLRPGGVGGTLLLEQLGPTGRCVIPTTDQTTGYRDDDAEPRETLMEYRPLPYGDGPHGGPTFGTWLAPRLPLPNAELERELAVGQALYCKAMAPVTAAL
jgi:hypothetical protein